MAEEVVARDDDDVVVNLLLLQDEVQVADGSELVGVVGGLVVDDGELDAGAARAVILCPTLEVPGELSVGDDVDVVLSL